MYQCNYSVCTFLEKSIISGILIVSKIVLQYVETLIFIDTNDQNASAFLYAFNRIEKNNNVQITLYN